MNLKVFFGSLATVIALFSYIPYFRDVFAGRTKPHAFSWLVWAAITTIGFFGQLSGGAGSGAWVTGFTAIACTAIFFLGTSRGERTITRSDWWSLIGAGSALALWFLTKGPLLSVILITLVDALGFFPTFRKSYVKPHEETLITYAISGLKFLIAFFALEKVSLVTALYPVYLVCANWAFVAMLILRRNVVTTAR